jgi:hypothetical protein
MIPLADSSPRSAARHRRWFSPGRGEARAKTMLAGNLTFPIEVNVAKRCPRNTHRRNSSSSIRCIYHGALTTSRSP